MTDDDLLAFYKRRRKALQTEHGQLMDEAYRMLKMIKELDHKIMVMEAGNSHE